MCRHISEAGHPSPTPQPPRPHDYAIERAKVAELPGEGDDRRARFEVTVVNSGGELGPSLLPVTMAIDGQDPRTIHVIEDPVAGSVHHISPVADVEGGQHTAVFSVNGKSRRLVFDVPAPDLAIELAPVSVAEDGRLLATVMVENIGDLRSRLGEVTGNWVKISPPGSGRAAPTGRFWGLDPGERRAFQIRTHLPQGEHRVTFRVRPFGYDQDLSNNAVSAVFDAQLAPLDVVSASTYQLGWPTSQSGLVDISVRIRNRGDHAANVPVGLVFADAIAGVEQPKTALAGLYRCKDALEGGCWLELGQAQVPAGVETTISSRLTLPAGEHELVAFVGDPGQKLGWVGEYFHRLPAQVDAQPPTLLHADIRARVAGYYADGTASIELTGSLWNLGARAYLEPVPLTLECRAGNAAVLGCGAQPAIQVADGFAPTPFAAELRVPLGSRVEIEAVFGEWIRQQAQVAVPESPLVPDLQVSVRSYSYADGTATIRISGSLESRGGLPIVESVPLALTCQVNGGGANECGKQPAVSLAGGTGPTPFAAELRVPIGARVAIEARFGELTQRSIRVAAPGVTGPDQGFPDFYQKILRVNGLTVASSASVPDAALYRAGAIANEMLAFNAAVRGAMADTRIAIIGRSEQLTDVPELSQAGPALHWYRGIANGNLAVAAEENILCYDDDPYGGRYDVLVHEFAHTISVRVPYSPGGQDFWDRLLPAYQAAMDAGLWRRTYAATSPGEYWAEGVQAWFNVKWGHGGAQNSINTRAELKSYDPRLAEVIEGVFGAASVTSSCHKPADDEDDNFYLLDGTITSAVGESIEEVRIVVSRPDGSYYGTSTSRAESTSSTAEFWDRLPAGRYHVGFLYNYPETCWLGFFGPGGWTLDREEATWLEVSESHTPMIEAVIPEPLDDLCGRATF